jgi:hypothetical protein
MEEVNTLAHYDTTAITAINVFCTGRLGTNALTYLPSMSVTKKKSFITLIIGLLALRPARMETRRGDIRIETP